MLKHVNHLVRRKGAKIINLDLTIICEEPKISKHKIKMKESLTKVLNIDLNRINIKATTTEKLGFLGRKEGIAAEAICSVKMAVLEE
jgi:2-C-methyl-D-erythritol 2,4-cyclodiphosphate synthase